MKKGLPARNTVVAFRFNSSLATGSYNVLAVDFDDGAKVFSADYQLSTKSAVVMGTARLFAGCPYSSGVSSPGTLLIDDVRLGPL